MDLKSVPSHSRSVVTRKTGSEYILVPVSNNIADMESLYTLNETGAFIWEQIDGKRSISEIITLLQQEYEIDEKSAVADVSDFFEKMRSCLVIE